MSSYEIDYHAHTDESLKTLLEVITREVNERIASKQEERDRIRKTNELVPAILYPQVEAIVLKYKPKAWEAMKMKRPVKKARQGWFNDEPSKCYIEGNTKLRELTIRMGNEIGELIPKEEREWFEEEYEFGTSPMLDLHMDGATLAIMKLHLWCTRCTPQETVWVQMIPCFLARDIDEMKEFDG